ncbi:polysaccharide pyruvyl transferase family protein [Allorhodopirellula solitaria]|uniref:Polysaccharide pyruvyl transferase n=1 Tax=Allorhodopirellula solitaria TaxID=2527987 RepID=A0A5C5WNR9_9BACT|nr:polysaccharide pyruvyl transferase family protein [Allorhodopirellula solitaria]TWT52130.1 Polysaccharide pyruvyl transferase [Allorhodopirellula solitaria]
MRVLYVTTRQWNPGDEFILAGSRRIVASAWGQPSVEAIYNKSPQVKSLFDRFNPLRNRSIGKLSGVFDSFVKLTEFDNSHSWFHDLEFYDAVVFAGSPAWFGGRVADLYKQLKDFPGKILCLGIGTPNKRIEFSTAELSALKSAQISVRNPELVDSLQKFGISSSYRPCPALFAAANQRQVESLESLAMVYTSDRGQRYQAVSTEHYRKQNSVFQQILDSRVADNTYIVCNYIDELERAQADFPGVEIRYSFDALSYENILHDADLVVSSRVHGCGLASSMGIPNLHLGHDSRSSTVNGFLSERANASAPVDWIQENRFSLNRLSSRLREHRELAFNSYLDWLGHGATVDASPELDTAVC